MGGVTGLAVDKDDNVWVLDRPNDLTDIELEAELHPPLADCCVRPPSMIHIDKNGNVIGSFDAPQGHGMAVDSKGSSTSDRTRFASMIRRPARWSARCLALPRGRPGGAGDAPLTSAHVAGHGSAGPVAGFIAPPGGGRPARSQRPWRLARQPPRHFAPSILPLRR